MINELLYNENSEIIINEKHVSIKNYKTIYSISNNKINILLKDKAINIIGNNLVITKLDKFDLKIKGNIKGIEFIDE
jgi:sporulation protein YqfC